MGQLELVSRFADGHYSNRSYSAGGYKMLKIRNLLVVFGMLFYSVAYADVQVSIGIDVPIYPELVVVPGYPVYYAPQLESNYFFYDGLYWVFQEDNWYESSWYNGPWWLVDPEDVPQFILRVPVSYYRRPPTFFFGWTAVSPPRWGEHWGRDWEQHRSGWDRWDHGSVNTPAPLPTYQRQYSGNRYPLREEQQHELQNQNYRYQPRDPEVKPHSRDQADQKAPNQQGKPQRDQQAAPEDNGAKQQDRRPDQRSESPQRDNEDTKKSNPGSTQQDRPTVQDDRQRSNQQAVPNQQTSPNQQDRNANQRSQSSQKVRVDTQRLAQPSSQQRRPSAQSTRQQSRQGAAQGEQQKQKTQSQKARPQRKNTQTEPKQEQGQGQEKSKRRNE